MDTRPFWSGVESTTIEWDVLEHPFYARWSAGTMEDGELGRYAGQYRHAVRAIAAASSRAAQLAERPLSAPLTEHSREEHEHIALWHRFLVATLGDDLAARPGERPREETVRCAMAWTGPMTRPLAEHLAVLYAIESAQHSISRVKLEGLVEHYGFEEGPATEYFSLHAERDVEHAALLKGVLDPMLEGEDGAALLAAVEDTYRAYWGLLDGLEDAHGQ